MTKALHLIVCILSTCLFSMAFADDNVRNAKEKNIIIEGTVVNSATGFGVKDTIQVEALHPDSTLITSTKCNVYYNRYPDETTIFNPFRLVFSLTDKECILKLSHPDYKSVYFKVTADKGRKNVGELPIRKLTFFEKSHNLQEVTVTASIVQFVNKGDTISYNADAFALAQGSMLDALIEQLPGAEINENGQIYVNGRFIDKLMLDGKDFFKDNRLVLMQNLPAYAIKNIKIYEEASTTSSVLGKSSQDGGKKDPLVMDLILKKSFKAAWIVNAEAGGGTNRRYRGRAFATGYTSSIRFGAYAFANNINETRNPGRSGNWSPASTKNGMTSTKEGGLDYQFSTHDRRFDINGSASASYRHVDENFRTNTQYFLSTGDTYSSAWEDVEKRDLKLATNHTLKLKPAKGNKYASQLNLSLTYEDNKDNTYTTEGNFNELYADIPDLRDRLQNGLPDDLNIINRYLYTSQSRNKDLYLKWDMNTTFSTGDGNGISILGNGNFNRGYYRDEDSYIFQTTGSDETNRMRRNPKDYHSYQYWLGARYVWKANDSWTISPFYGFCHWYKYNSDQWYSDGENPAGQPFSGFLPSVRESMMAFDRKNSYETGWFNSHHFLSLGINYYHTTLKNGKEHSRFEMYLTPSVNLFSRHLDFHGLNEQKVEKKYPYVDSSLDLIWFLPGMAPRLNLKYRIQSIMPDLMNFIDVAFDTDPLNVRLGNPDLKSGWQHVVEGGFQSKKRYFGRLLLNVSFKTVFEQGKTSMSYSYNSATGVKTWKPVNVNGNREGWLNIGTDLFLDRPKRFRFRNNIRLYPQYSVDMLSYDYFETSVKSVVNSFSISDNARFEYTIGKNLVAFDFSVSNRKATSPDLKLSNINITRFSYGIRGRAHLPWGLEFSTDLKMYSNRGFDSSSMNDNQLVWNARLTKKFAKPGLTVMIDGYDILGNVKSISYTVDAQSRVERWVNSVPHYVMLSLRWDFTKK